MSLAQRVKQIVTENGLNQKEFASSINVTDSHISKVIAGKCGLSNSTAALIEKIYGFSADWIQNGTEPKMTYTSREEEYTPLQRRLIAEVEKMKGSELAAVKAFIDSLHEYQKDISEEE